MTMAKIEGVGKARLPFGYNSTSRAQMARKRSFGVSIRINDLRYFRGTYYTNLGRASIYVAENRKTSAKYDNLSL